MTVDWDDAVDAMKDENDLVTDQLECERCGRMYRAAFSMSLCDQCLLEAQER